MRAAIIASLVAVIVAAVTIGLVLTALQILEQGMSDDE